MPIILKPDKMHIETSENGWTRTSLANYQTIGTTAIVAQHWSFEPFSMGPEQEHEDTDELLYVISGEGTIRINDTALILERETVIWLEPGDVYQLIAGEMGLEILQGYAPGD